VDAGTFRLPLDQTVLRLSGPALPTPNSTQCTSASRDGRPGRLRAGRLARTAVAAALVSLGICAAAADGTGGPAGRAVSWKQYAQATGAPEGPPGAAPSALAAPPIPASVAAVRLSDIAGRDRVRVDPTLPAMRDHPRLERADVRTSVEQALTNSYELAGARSRSQAQRFQVGVATGALRSRIDLRAANGMENARPSARIDAETGSTLPSSTHRREDTALVLRQPLYDAGGRSELERQRALLGSSEAGVDAARDQVTVDAATAHLDVLQYTLASEFAGEYRTELEKLFAQVNARVEAGGASPAEAERVKARAIGARSSSIEAGGALESALLTYRRLVGAVPGDIPADDVLAPATLPTLEEAIARAKARNPQLSSLRGNQRAIEAEFDTARAKLQPRLELEVGNYRVNGASGSTQPTNEARAMLVVSWNLLNGGADIAASNAALARLEENRYRILDAERRIEEALRISYNTLNAVERRAQSVREEFVANRRVVDAFRAQLTSGNRPLLDVLDAEQRLYQSRIELLRLTVLQATLTLQALRQIGLIDGEVAGKDPGDIRAPDPASERAPRTPAPPGALPPAPAPPPAAPAVPSAGRTGLATETVSVRDVLAATRGVLPGVRTPPAALVATAVTPAVEPVPALQAFDAVRAVLEGPTTPTTLGIGSIPAMPPVAASAATPDGDAAADVLASEASAATPTNAPYASAPIDATPASAGDVPAADAADAVQVLRPDPTLGGTFADAGRAAEPDALADRTAVRDLLEAIVALLRTPAPATPALPPMSAVH
jgi:adhesin transport system outer membrane protein